MKLIDGHLDLAMCGVLGRDLALPLEELRQHDPFQNQTATVSFPELRATGLRLCFGTLFALPQGKDYAGYTDHAGAKAQAIAQLEQYQRWQDAGLIRLLEDREAVKAYLDGQDETLGVVLLMEGADPIRDADDLPQWVGRGVRVVGPAWERTRYAGGTDAAGPLTEAGKELVQAMKELGVTLDASHLDDASFWDAAEIGPKMIATHSNSRALVAGNRHLTDEMARALAEAGGVIGLVYLSRFIQGGWQEGDAKASLSELARHAEHYAALVGWEHIGLGTDMDGGFGAEKTPAGVERYRDVPKLLAELPAEQREAVAYGNWARWLREWL